MASIADILKFLQRKPRKRRCLVCAHVLPDRNTDHICYGCQDDLSVKHALEATLVEKAREEEARQEAVMLEENRRQQIELIKTALREFELEKQATTPATPE